MPEIKLSDNLKGFRNHPDKANSRYNQATGKHFCLREDTEVISVCVRVNLR